MDQAPLLDQSWVASAEATCQTSFQIKNKQTVIWFTDEVEVEVKPALCSDARKRRKMLNILQMFAVYGIPTIIIMFLAPYIIIGKNVLKSVVFENCPIKILNSFNVVQNYKSDIGTFVWSVINLKHLISISNLGTFVFYDKGLIPQLKLSTWDIEEEFEKSEGLTKMELSALSRIKSFKFVSLISAFQIEEFYLNCQVLAL